MRAVYAAQMREADRYMIENMGIPSVVLMENAAEGLCRLCKCEGVVYALCGAGNNGGDGFAAARRVIARGGRAVAVLLGDAQKLKGDAALNARFFINTGTLIEIGDVAGLDMLFKRVGRGDVIIDALLGTGLKREVSGLYAAAAERINASLARVVAADIPSGVNADDGTVMGAAVRADATVAMQYPKPGHFLFPGRELTGELSVVKIGVDEGCPALKQPCLEALWAKDGVVLPRRKLNTHKGTYGKLAVFCGAIGYTGAGVLCVNAAIRAGAGLVYAVVPAKCADVYAVKLLTSVLTPIDRFSVDQAMGALDGKNCVCIGPGLGTDERSIPLLKQMLAMGGIKKLMDADAINLIAREPDMLSAASNLVLTPHPKEFSRLTGASVGEIAAYPLEYARKFAKAHPNITLLLKGATTVAAQGERACLICAGGPGMAKGGSGDVLSGVVSALLAQGMGCYDAAKTGAYLCGRSGEKAAQAYGEYSATPEETIELLGEAFKEAEG